MGGLHCPALAPCQTTWTVIIGRVPCRPSPVCGITHSIEKLAVSKTFVGFFSLSINRLCCGSPGAPLEESGVVRFVSYRAQLNIITERSPRTGPWRPPPSPRRTGFRAGKKVTRATTTANDRAGQGCFIQWSATGIGKPAPRAPPFRPLELCPPLVPEFSSRGTRSEEWQWGVNLSI